MGKFLLVFLGGGAGSMARYGVSLLAARWYGTAFPWGTLAVNLAGCLLIGVLFALAEQRVMVSPEARLLLMTGFLGGLTTFSTFALETADFGRSGLWSTSLLNLLANNLLGLALVLAGIWLAQHVLTGD